MGKKTAPDEVCMGEKLQAPPDFNGGIGELTSCLYPHLYRRGIATLILMHNLPTYDY